MIGFVAFDCTLTSPASFSSRIQAHREYIVFSFHPSHLHSEETLLDGGFPASGRLVFCLCCFGCGWLRLGVLLVFSSRHLRVFPLPSMMTWALRPHGVRTRGKKNSEEVRRASGLCRGLERGLKGTGTVLGAVAVLWRFTRKGCGDGRPFLNTCASGGGCVWLLIGLVAG